MARGLWLCRACRHQTSVTAGTIFQDRRLPLRFWFRALWYVTSQKHGVSALGLQRVVGLGSYQTAWAWLHKLRRAMVRPGRDRLSGRVEVDETYIGGPEAGVIGRRTYAKAQVLIAAQVEGRGIGRIRLARVSDLTRATPHGFIHDCVTPGAVICTNGLATYRDLEGYGHEVVVLQRQDQPASDLLPRVHLVVALLKRWLLGTHHGAVRISHLDYYLDEFVFRFNRRQSACRGKLFYHLVQQAVQVEPQPYHSLHHHHHHLLGSVESSG